MSILPIGPDGMIVVYALLVSAIVALLIRRQVGSAKMVLIVLAAAILLAVWQYLALEPADMVRQAIRASFVIVPSAVLLAGARITWLTQRAWSFILIGPLTFVLCYTAICELCYRAGLI